MTGHRLTSTRLLAALLWAAVLGSGFGERSFYFSYNHHGEDWAEGECASRDRQSPIDFSYHAPWDCKPPVFPFLKHFLGEDIFKKMGFGKLSGDEPEDDDVMSAAGGAAGGSPAPAAEAAFAPAPAAASLLETGEDISQVPGFPTVPPMPVITPTKAPMIIPGCGQLGAFFFKYDPVEKPLTIQNNGHAISTDLKGHGLGSINWEGFVFDVLSVNFHVGSEHTFKGKQLPLELHIVHREPETDHILIVAIPFDELPKAAGSLLQRKSQRGLRGGTLQAEPVTPAPDFLKETRVVDPDVVADAAKLSPEEEGEIVPITHHVVKKPMASDAGFNEALANLVTFPLPVDGETKTVPLRHGPVDVIAPLMGDPSGIPQAYFQYRGSLTAPPCSEQVTWLVRKEPLLASHNQIEAIRFAIKEANSNFNNARSVMPLMGRHILYKLGIQGEAPPPASVPQDPDAVPKERFVDFSGVATSKEAMFKALETQAAKDSIVGSIAEAQAARAAAGASVDMGIAMQANNMVSADDLMITTPIPTANPEVVLSRIVDAVAHQMDGSEKAAALAAAGITMPAAAPAPAVMMR